MMPLADLDALFDAQTRRVMAATSTAALLKARKLPVAAPEPTAPPSTKTRPICGCGRRCSIGRTRCAWCRLTRRSLGRKG